MCRRYLSPSRFKSHFLLSTSCQTRSLALKKSECMESDKRAIPNHPRRSFKYSPSTTQKSQLVINPDLHRLICVC